MLPGVSEAISCNSILQSRSRVPNFPSRARVFQGHLVIVTVSHVARAQFIIENAGAKYVQMRQIKAPDDGIYLRVAQLHCFVVLQEVAVFGRKGVERSRGI